MNRLVRKVLALVFIVTCFGGLLVNLSVQAGTVEVVTQKDAKMSLGKTLDSQQIQNMKYILGGQSIPDNEIIWVDGDMINQYLKDGSNAYTGVYSSAIVVPKPQGFGVRIQIVTPDKINLVTATTYQNAAITSGAKDVLIKIATPIDVTGEGALVGLYAMLQKTGQLQDPVSPKVAQDEIKVINHIRKEYNVYNTNVNVLLADLKLAINKYYINNNVVINDEDLTVLINQKFTNAGLDIEDPDTQQMIQDFLKEYAQTKPGQSRDTYDQLNLSIMSQGWDSLLAGFNKVLTPEILLEEKLPDYTDTKYYNPIFPKVLDTLFKAIEKTDGSGLATVKEIYNHTFIIEKALGVPTERERAALNYFRTIAYHYVAYSEDGQNTGQTKNTWLENIRRYRALAQEPRVQEIVDRIGMSSGYPMEANQYASFSQEDTWIKTSVNNLEVAYNVKTEEVATFNKEEAEPEPIEDIVDFSSTYGVNLENNRTPVTDVAQDFAVDDQANDFVAGQAPVAGEPDPATTSEMETTTPSEESIFETTDETTTETTSEATTETFVETTNETTVESTEEDFPYELGEIKAGETSIDVTVQANEVYKLVFDNGDETADIEADATGIDTIEFGDPTLTPEGSEIKLFVKGDQDYQEVASTKVLPGAEDESTEMTESETSLEESTETEATTETESESEATTEAFPYELGEIKAGETSIDVTVQANEIYKLVFGSGDETADIEADATGIDTIEFGDPTLTPEGSEIKLFVKGDQDYQEVASTKVLPGAEDESTEMTESETSLEESTETEATTETETESETTTMEVIDFDYQISDIFAGQTMIDIVVQPNEVYQIAFADGNRTEDLTADETGYMSLDFGDPALTPEGSEIKLFVKRDQDYQEVASMIVQADPSSLEETSNEELLESTSLLDEESSEGMMSEEELSQASEDEFLTNDLYKELWNTDKSKALQDFIKEWQVPLNQSYVRIDTEDLDLDQTPYQDKLLKDLLDSVKIGNQEVNLIWYDVDQPSLDEEAEDQANVFEVITDGNHVYVFGLYKGQAKVFHAEGLNSEGQFELTPTENQEIQEKFKEIYSQP